MIVTPLHKFLVRFFVCSTMVFSGSLAFADDCGSAPVPYTANYSVTRKNKLAGSMRVELERLQGERFVYRMDSRVKWGIVRSLIQQQSRFTWKDAMVMPDHFVSTQKVAFYKRVESVDFNWNSMTAAGTKRRDDFKLEIQAGMQDKLTIYLYLAEALCQGENSVQTDVVSGPVLKPHSYQFLALETLDTPLGRLPASHFRMGTPDSEKQTDVWLSKETRFLPVKLVHRDKKDISRMDLTGISFSNNP